VRLSLSCLKNRSSLKARYVLYESFRFTSLIIDFIMKFGSFSRYNNVSIISSQENVNWGKLSEFSRRRVSIFRRSTNFRRFSRSSSFIFGNSWHRRFSRRLSWIISFSNSTISFRPYFFIKGSMSPSLN